MKKMAIEYFKSMRQKVCEEHLKICPKDSIAYQATLKEKEFYDMAIQALEQEPKIGHCKDCKYFEYNSVAKVDGIPLIVAHEICKRWGDGCKTSEDGYCFLFESKESEDKE